jgi:hypothetical protein
MSLGHFLDVYNGLARCPPVLQYIGKTGFFIFVMLGKAFWKIKMDKIFFVGMLVAYLLYTLHCGITLSKFPQMLPKLLIKGIVSREMCIN